MHSSRGRGRSTSDRESSRVEIVYATPDVQRVVSLPLAAAMTAGDAVAASGLLREFPEIAQRPLLIGIHGQPCSAGQVLADGDRVEIYRPLRADPREQRRRLVAERDTKVRSGRRAGR